MRVGRRWMWCAVVAAGVLAACGGDDGAAVTPSSSEPIVTPDGPVSPALADMLRFVPDTPANRATLLDYAGFERARGGLPAATAADDLQLLLTNTGQQLLLPPIGRGVADPEFASAAGFDTRQVSAALAQYSFDRLVVLAGDMDPSAVATAVQASDETATVSVDGSFTLVSAGDGRGSLREMSVLRPDGRGLRWALGDGALIAAFTDEQVAESRAAAGQGRSLANAADYAAVAAALDAAGAVNASIMAEYPSPEGASAQPSDEAWDVLGIGEVFGGDTSTLTLVFRYSDEGTAADQVAAFPAHLDEPSAIRGAPWSVTFTLQEIHADGLTVVATLQCSMPGAARMAVLQRDNLFTFG